MNLHLRLGILKPPRTSIDQELFPRRDFRETKVAKMVDDHFQDSGSISEAEDRFTATGSKLIYHREAMLKFHETGYATPIVTHIMPTDLCNLECSFCSVRDRIIGMKTNTYGMELDKIGAYLSALVERGLKAVILSGGGEPTLYQDKKGHDYRDLISLIKAYKLDIGLITNGTRLNKYEDTIDDSFKWIRVSLYPTEYGLDIIQIGKRLPEETVLGFSLILSDEAVENELPRQGGNTEKNLFEHYRAHIDQILPFIRKLGGQYLRIAPDCHTHGSIFYELHRVADALRDIFSGNVSDNGFPLVFHQHKKHGTPESCFLGYFHPVLNADGLVYPCDSNILNDALVRRFKPVYSIATWSTISILYDVPVRSLVNSGKMCPRCVFAGNNDRLEEILREGIGTQINEAPIHVNFI